MMQQPTLGIPCLRTDCKYNNKTDICSPFVTPEIIPLTYIDIKTGETTKYAICKLYEVGIDISSIGIGGPPELLDKLSKGEPIDIELQEVALTNEPKPKTKVERKNCEECKTGYMIYSYTDEGLSKIYYCSNLSCNNVEVIEAIQE